MSVPSITVVTVVFNAVKAGRAEALRRAMASVAKQKNCAYEHLIVDGASQDGTLAIIQEAAARDERIRVVSEPDRGLYDAMNKGLRLARGKYIGYLNSDDAYVSERALAASFEVLETEKADFSYAPTLVYDESGKKITHPFTEASPSGIFSGMTFCHQSMFARTEVLRELGGFDLRYRSAADYELLLKMIFSGAKAVRVAETVAEFTCGGFSFEHADLADAEVIKVYEEVYSKALNAPVSSDLASCIRHNTFFPCVLQHKLAKFGEVTFGKDFEPKGATRDIWRLGAENRLLNELGVEFFDGLSRLRRALFTLTHFTRILRSREEGCFARRRFLLARAETAEKYRLIMPTDIPARIDKGVFPHRFGLGVMSSLEIPLPEELITTGSGELEAKVIMSLEGVDDCKPELKLYALSVPARTEVWTLRSPDSTRPNFVFGGVALRRKRK